MQINRTICIATLSLAVACLMSCRSGSSEHSVNSTAPSLPATQDSELKATYDGLGQSGGKVFALDPKQSDVRIYAFRGGPFAKVGHNHVLSAPMFTGYFYQPPTGGTGTRFDLEFRLDALEIDNPEYRSKLGPAFASKLSAPAIEGTRDHMLGADNLEADKFPLVTVKSLEITGETPKFAVKVQMTLHGQQRELLVPLTVEGLPDQLVVTGAFSVRQTDFGAKPYSVLGGLMTVEDEVVIEFRLTGH